MINVALVQWNAGPGQKWCKRGRKSAASLAFCSKPPAGLGSYGTGAQGGHQGGAHLPQREGRGRPLAACTGILQAVPWADAWKLLAAHKAGQLKFFGQHTHLAERKAFVAYLAPLRKRKWYVYSKPPFGGPNAVLAYLSR